MGKIPPSFRSAIGNPNIRNPSSLFPSSSSSSPPSPYKPFLNKQTRPNKKPSSIPTPKSLFKSSNLQDAIKTFNSIAHSSSDFPRFPNSILHSFTKVATSTSDSITFFNHITKTLPSFIPDRSTFHILLSNSPTLSSIHQTLNLMQNSRITPDAATADIAVRSLCLAASLDHAVELIKQFAQKHCLPDTYTFNFLIKHLCKSRSLTTVYNFIDEMRDNFGIKPDLVTYTILIDNVCNSRNLNLREALRLVSVLREEGFKPDCFVYNTIMKGYCVLSRGGEAIEVYNQMKEDGVEPDLVTYNTLVFGLAKSGRVTEAKKLLRVMAEKGYFPDEVTYTSLMNGMCRKGDVLAAMALLGEMEARGCSPNECTYNTLLHGLCKARLVEKAVEFYGVIKKGGMKLETGSYATFVRALCRDGRVAEVYEVFDYAVETKSLTDVTAYSTLESTFKWLKKAKEQGLAV